MASQDFLVFHNGSIILPDRIVEDGTLICRDGVIQTVGQHDARVLPSGAIEIDAQGGFISPGFVDIHVHGGDGADFMDGTPEAFVTANRAHAQHGTTTIFPTTTTGSREQISAMLNACRQAQSTWNVENGARIGGAHFYGPYFAEDKVGCHLHEGRRDPTPDEYLESFDLNIIRVATCAAELSGAEEFYCEAQRRGYLVTCGHSNASWTEMARGFEAGMRHVDHFWCAMSSVPSMRERFGTPTQGSMAEFVLMHDAMSTEVIADGQHLAPELLEFAYRMKGAERLCLVTDANRALDMPPGEYSFGPQSNGEVFTCDGKVGFQPGRGLASSVVGMETMVRNMAQMTSAGITDAVRMGSLTPAERVGMGGEIGSLEAGKRADVLILNAQMEAQRVFIGGYEYNSD